MVNFRLDRWVEMGLVEFEFCVYSLPFVVVNGFEKNGVMKTVER